MNETTADNEFKLGRLAGLAITATPSAIVGFLVLWIVFTVIGYGLIKLSLGNALLGGLAAALIHYFGDLWHQLGHSVAARSVGHPMSGIRFGFLGILSSSIYPSNEDALPPAVHIRRALGGPLASLVMSIVAAILFLAVNTTRSGGTVWWLALFFLFVNFVVFTLEVFIPLGFNDASTILAQYQRTRAK